jgi:hypothetical protein
MSDGRVIRGAEYPILLIGEKDDGRIVMSRKVLRPPMIVG